jgi:hypothetical protein
MSNEKLSNVALNPPLRKGVVMPRFYYRITNALKIGWWAFKNPDSLKESNFKMLSDLFGLIMKVATEDRNMMTHLAYVHPEVLEWVLNQQKEYPNCFLKMQC